MTEGRQRKKPRNKNEVQRFWNFVPDEERNTAEMLLYGEISEYSWYGDEITPSVFNQELKDLGAVDEITVRINSGGGDVFAAVAIYTRLKEHKAKISVKIDGWCASAATIIAMAGDTIEISVGGVFMIHDPLAGLIGYYNTTDLENIVKELETIKQSIVNCYMTVTDKSEEEIKSLMTNEGMVHRRGSSRSRLLYRCNVYRCGYRGRKCGKSNCKFRTYRLGEIQHDTKRIIRLRQ